MIYLYLGFALFVTAFAVSASYPNTVISCFRNEPANSAHIPHGIPLYFILHPSAFLPNLTDSDTLLNHTARRILRNGALRQALYRYVCICRIASLLPPTASALLHNTSTLGISLKNMTDLLDEAKLKQDTSVSPDKDCFLKG